MLLKFLRFLPTALWIALHSVLPMPLAQVLLLVTPASVQCEMPLCGIILNDVSVLANMDIGSKTVNWLRYQKSFEKKKINCLRHHMTFFAVYQSNHVLSNIKGCISGSKCIGQKIFCREVLVIALSTVFVSYFDCVPFKQLISNSFKKREIFWIKGWTPPCSPHCVRRIRSRRKIADSSPVWATAGRTDQGPHIPVNSSPSRLLLSALEHCNDVQQGTEEIGKAHQPIQRNVVDECLEANLDPESSMLDSQTDFNGLFFFFWESDAGLLLSPQCSPNAKAASHRGWDFNLRAVSFGRNFLDFIQ